MFEYPFCHLIAKIPLFLHLQMLFNNKELIVCIMNDLLKKKKKYLAQQIDTILQSVK